MNILVTGGLGNIGTSVVDECLERGHAVTILEVRNKRTERAAKKYSRRGAIVHFGDLRDIESVERSVAGQDAVIHLAAILPPASDRHPELCDAVNRGGTANLVEAILGHLGRTPLVEVSSASVMGPTQDRLPPVRPDDPLSSIDAYSRSKIAAERIVASSGLRYCTLRLAAVMPSSLGAALASFTLNIVKVIFDMPLEARCEIVLDLDVAYALVSAAENLVDSDELVGKSGFIAGGKGKGCQMRIRDMLEGIFATVGLELPNEALFSPKLDSYYLDWYDTDEIESILKYQRHSFEQWRSSIRKAYPLVVPVARLLRPLIMKWIERQSPRFEVRTA